MPAKFTLISFQFSYAFSFILMSFQKLFPEKSWINSNANVTCPLLFSLSNFLLLVTGNGWYENLCLQRCQAAVMLLVQPQSQLLILQFFTSIATLSELQLHLSLESAFSLNTFILSPNHCFFISQCKKWISISSVCHETTVL